MLKTWKNRPQKLLFIGSNIFFQYCQSAKNQPKSHFLFQKNVSLRAFYKMTLFVIYQNNSISYGTTQCLEIFIRVEENFSTPMYVNEKKILLLVWEMRTSSSVEVKSLDSTSYSCVILQTAWCWPKKEWQIRITIINSLIIGLVNKETYV